MEKESPFILVKSFIITTVSFLLPIFFLPFTQEFFITNKLYLLNLTALVLLVLSSIEILLSGKLNMKLSVREIILLIFILTVAVSTFFVSPNPTQALFNPHFNLLTIASLTIIYFHAVRTDVLKTVIIPLLASSIIVSALALLNIVFKPFKGIEVPLSLQFLKNPGFTPIGSQIDLAIFLGFVMTLTGCLLYEMLKKTTRVTNTTPYWIVLALSVVAFITVVFFIITDKALLTLPTLKLSWYAGLEVLKNPVSALFGAGVDNFSTIFTKVKDIDYNQSTQWHIGSFTVSRSVYLHILTETGLVGLTSFILFLSLPLFYIFSKNKENEGEYLVLPYIFLVISMFFAPPSLILFFLLFISLTFVYSDVSHEPKNIVPLNFVLAAIIFFGSLWLFFFLGKTYIADFNMKRSIDGMVRNDLNKMYDGQRRAILLNPKNENYRVAFSQVNAMLARNVAAKASQASDASAGAQLIEQDKQIIAQSIQASIAEAKAAIALNPQKASHWENLAGIYRGIIETAEGADAWTISSYQRAIGLDPQNPAYRLSLGGVHYLLGNYESALTLFEQTTALKPDWPNAYYNLAWAAYNQKDYQKAINAMEKVIALTDKQKNKRDYDKAVKELVKFKTTVEENVAGIETSNQTQ